MNKRYRIEQNRSRTESLEGAKPLRVEWAGCLLEAEKKMEELRDGGQFYAAVFIHHDGEVVMETEDVQC
ncbi:MAG: hypothetical protein KJ890_15505 [Gammaproteobacteria bacterium]|nr:hypothetical protein [Gammaproteobacteria bacterium]MBU0801662.1 hypothetical protein [Alphaproteobacteria bacterium]MBU1803835.1 hypothetical protein [Gammaproteobacteria bacterium]